MEAKAERLRQGVVGLGRTRRNEAIPLALRAESAPIAASWSTTRVMLKTRSSLAAALASIKFA